MGADWHVYLEYKKPGGKWEAHPNHREWTDYIGIRKLEEVPSLSGRNYVLFGIVAGVRGGDTLFSARGLPVDISEAVSSQFDDGYHTPTWLTFYEFERCFKKWVKEWNRYYSDPSDKLHSNHPASDAWKKSGISTAIFTWIRQELTIEEVENKLLGLRRGKTKYRFVIWFDS